MTDWKNLKPITIMTCGLLIVSAAGFYMHRLSPPSRSQQNMHMILEPDLRKKFPIGSDIEALKQWLIANGYTLEEGDAPTLANGRCEGKEKAEVKDQELKADCFSIRFSDPQHCTANGQQILIPYDDRNKIVDMHFQAWFRIC